MKKSDKNKMNFAQKAVITSAVLIMLLIIFTVVGVVTWPQRTLKQIDKQIANENYQAAEETIMSYEKRIEDADLGEYKDVCNYNLALTALEQGNSKDARYRLQGLGNDYDTAELLKECDYIDAHLLAEEGNYEEAYAKYVSLKGYKDADTKVHSMKYEIAKNTYETGDIVKAMELFAELGDFSDAKKMSEAIALEVTGADNIEDAYKILQGMNVEEMQKIAHMTEVRKNLPQNVLAVGAHHTVGLKYDGTVLAVGLNEDGQCDVQSWSGIITVDAGAYHTVGLTADGKVVTVGNNEYGQCDVEDWENVVDVAAGAYDTYAVLSDGTVVWTGFSKNSLEGISDIKHIGAGSYAAACIDSNGVVFTTHDSLFINDSGALDVDLSTGYIVALMADGTISTSYERVSGWEDIAAISAGSNMVLGIKDDGSIEAYFFSQRDAMDFSEYDNVLAVAAGGAHSAILLDEGKVIAFGENDNGQCDVDEWKLTKTS